MQQGYIYYMFDGEPFYEALEQMCSMTNPPMDYHKTKNVLMDLKEFIGDSWEIGMSFHAGNIRITFYRSGMPFSLEFDPEKMQRFLSLLKTVTGKE